MAVTTNWVRLASARFPSLFVFCTIFAIVATLVPSEARADPGEGGSAALSAKLEEAATAYYDIQAKLAASQKRQVEIKKKLQAAEASLVLLSEAVATIAAERYKSGQLGLLKDFLFGQGATEEVLRGAAVGQYLTWRDDEQLRKYREARDEAQRNRDLLEQEVANEKAQLKELDKQKRTAEKALAAVGGMVSAGYDGPVPTKAQPAPRNADGSFPRESCSINDPTTGGCLTPRTFHAVNEARLAKFNRAVYCWRVQSWGEHPKGRACDFSLKTSGFGGIATASEKVYGTRLAQFFIRNASALGVIYVIWYRQIWTPGIGWRWYFGTGSSSREHTNHVHLSMA
jgi:hypothetical protein